MNFKLLFPTGYQVTDVFNDNLDIHVILENGEVYFGMVFTIANVQYFLDTDNEPFFWAIDMLIVKDLSQESLMASVASLLDQNILDKVFSKIGQLNENGLYEGVSFTEINNMGTGFLTGI